MKSHVCKPIGEVRHGCPREEVPRHWTVSSLPGELVLFPEYRKGLRDIRVGERIIVLFLFHESPPFEPSMLVQRPPHKKREYGVFSICSPRRPNPIGMSVVEVQEVQPEEGRIGVRGLDMFDSTPIIDLKPMWR